MTHKSAGCLAVFGILAGCAGTGVTPGTPRDVAKAAADAYVAAGHRCQVKADLAYCDTTGTSSTLPLLIGYDKRSQEILFATVFDTESAFGRPCPTLHADLVTKPEWMVVKCDEIEYEDKTKKTVLAVVGGGRMPDQGMSRAELNRSANLFMHEAEGYLVRLKVTLVQQEEPSQSVVNDTRSTQL